MRLLNRIMGRAPNHEGPVDFQDGARRLGGAAAGLGALAILGGVAAGSLGFEAAGEVVAGGMVITGLGVVALTAGLTPNESDM